MAAVAKPTTRVTGDGFERGKKIGANSLLQSPVLENMALELVILRTVVKELTGIVKRQEDDLIWWRDMAECYREELNK